MVLEKTLESPLDCKEIQPVHSEGDQPWDFFGMPLEAGRLYTIVCTAVGDRVNLSGELENHLRGSDLGPEGLAWKGGRPLCKVCSCIV